MAVETVRDPFTDDWQQPEFALVEQAWNEHPQYDLLAQLGDERGADGQVAWDICKVRARCWRTSRSRGVSVACGSSSGGAGSGALNACSTKAASRGLRYVSPAATYSIAPTTSSVPIVFVT